MNQNQHYFLVRLQGCEARVAEARRQLDRLVVELAKARKLMQDGINRDPGSWYGTPGVMELFTPAPKKPGCTVVPMTQTAREMLTNGDPYCKHRWQLICWSGWECNDCNGWVCS